MRLPRITTYPMLALFVAASAWLVLVLTAAYMVPAGTIPDLTGTVGTYDNRELIDGLPPLPRAIYWAGDIECHQIANRSFFLNDNQMPFCTRDLGLFAGFAAGFGIVAFYRYKIHPVLLFVGLVPMALDGGLQLVTDYESTNLLRIVTGTIAGLVTALFLAHMLFVLGEDSDLKTLPPQAPVQGREEEKP
jgi:uncharacterized membrane protein